jgi:hypothetical protein
MCSTCDDLKAKIQRARAEGNMEKARVMAVLLEDHKRNDHPVRHSVVVVSPRLVIWPDGMRWEVR